MADDKSDEVKWAGFNEKGQPLREEVVGSGISETKRHVWKPNFFSDLKQSIELPKPWSENRAMIVSVFGPVFARLAECPGRQRPQCCHAQPGKECLPNWREREDAEWYAQTIGMYPSVLRLRN